MVRTLQAIIAIPDDPVDDSDDRIFEKSTIGYHNDTESLLGYSTEADESRS